MSSTSKELSKFEKEKQKLVQEKCQGLLNEMLRDDDNKYCVDCDAKGPRWASWSLGIFLCIRCAGIHRNLGVHISRVKSVNLDSWTPEQVVTMQQMGNSRARAVYEANLPDNFRRPQTDVALENFIRAKYEHTKYIAQEWVKPPPPRVDWNSEIEEQIRKKKEKKPSSSDVVLPPGKVLGKSLGSKTTTTSVKPIIDVGNKKEPSSNSSSSTATPPPPITAPAAAPTTTSASDDLLALVSDDPFASPVKSTNNGDGSSSSELGGVFAEVAAAQQQQLGKMSKESILSLYGVGGGNTSTTTTASVLSNNPFVGGGGAGATNLFPGGAYPPVVDPSNGFGGFVASTPAQPLAVGGAAGLGQLQQGLFSLNLGAPVPGAQQIIVPPPQNSNLFASPPVPQPQSNLNMLMNNTASSSLFGAFASAPGLVGPPPQAPVPQPQQFMQQQQPNLFNNLHQMNQFGLFQNGGGPTGLVGNSSSSSSNSTAAAAGQNSVVNVDLLWK